MYLCTVAHSLFHNGNRNVRPIHQQPVNTMNWQSRIPQSPISYPNIQAPHPQHPNLHISMTDLPFALSSPELRYSPTSPIYSESSSRRFSRNVSESPQLRYSPYSPVNHQRSRTTSSASLNHPFEFPVPSPIGYSSTANSSRQGTPLSFGEPSPFLPGHTLSHEDGGPSAEPIYRARGKRTTKSETMLAVLQTLSKAKLSVTDLIAYILNDTSDNTTLAKYRQLLFSSNRTSFNFFLVSLWGNEKGQQLLKEWMPTHAIDLVCEKIHTEMEAAKPHLRMSTKEVTAEFINNWDITELMERVSREVTPTWTRVLEAASETRVSQKKKSPKSKNRVTVRRQPCFG